MFPQLRVTLELLSSPSLSAFSCVHCNPFSLYYKLPKQNPYKYFSSLFTGAYCILTLQKEHTFSYIVPWVSVMKCPWALSFRMAHWISQESILLWSLILFLGDQSLQNPKLARLLNTCSEMSPLQPPLFHPHHPGG